MAKIKSKEDFMKKIQPVFISLFLISLFFALFGCSNPSSSDNDNSAGSNNFSDDISLFNDNEVNILVNSASGITLSDGIWTYACDGIEEFQNTTPLEMRSFLTLQISNNGSTCHRTSMNILIRKKIPAGTTEAEINEIIEETKNEDYFLGFYTKGANVYRDGNYLYLNKTYSTQEIETLEGAENSTQIFNQLFYVDHPSSIVKTNTEKTKYKITVNETSGNAKVWIIKQ